MRAVRTIVAKEWADAFSHRLVVWIVVLVPLLLTAIPFVVLGVTSRLGVSDADYAELGPLLEDPMFAGLTPVEAMQSILASSFLVLFLIMPVMVPLTIATYSVVGEKMSRSLEPLLATPITTTQLLVAKGLAAAAPGVLSVWLCYALFLVGARLLVASDRVFALFLDPMWLVAMGVLAPLLTVLAVTVGLIVSSRTSDPRAAKQVGSLVVLPLMLLVIGPLTGFIRLSGLTFWVSAGIVTVADIALGALAVRLFQRENILTRWK
jgi:ABC-2 type transport system permease protein